MDTLTPAEEDAVTQFVSITSYQGAPHTAIPYLRAAEWNLERAIIMYFESTPHANEQLNSSARRVNFPGSFPGDNTLNEANDTPSRPQSSGNTAANAISEFFDSIKRRIESFGSSTGQYIPLTANNFSSTRTFASLSPKSKVVYVIQLILYMPVLILHKLTLALFYILTKVFPIINKLTMRYSQNRSGSRSEPKGVDPAQIARNFINEFNMYHRNENILEFYEGGYTSALYIAKRDARFMVVFLHSEEHDDANSFINGTLLDDKVSKFFKEHNVLVWGGNVMESEAYQVSNVLGATRYPFMALLSLKTNTVETPDGTTSGSPTMSVVSKIQGLVPPEILIEKFSNQVDRLEPSLIAIRTERQEQALSRLMRQQQDQAYQASLQRDRAIADQRRRERELQASKEQWLKWRVTTLTEEPPTQDKTRYARVAIRMSSGERIQRRFAKDVSLEEIYAFVELYQKGLLSSSQSNELVDQPQGFEYKFDFKLISPMPRVVVEPKIDVKVQDEPVVWPNGNLVVEMND